ncbi:MAG: 50S ribosomal protein L13 [Planctomycetaceae bacterium]|jgi:large subunit ribosomal protein L13|nr:50S ribosomal protein L13 [Planctomycetaceae bacterium]
MTNNIKYIANDKTYMAKPNEVSQKWYLVDATDKVVGRLASDIAMILMGKHRATYTPHIDTGEYVVVTNADKSIFTGKKLEQKKYTRYTGYPGLRVETAKERFARKPELVLIESVRRMLPKNNLAKRMLQKLKVYKSNEQHPHQAQNPEVIELAITRKRTEVK